MCAVKNNLFVIVFNKLNIIEAIDLYRLEVLSSKRAHQMWFSL